VPLISYNFVCDLHPDWSCILDLDWELCLWGGAPWGESQIHHMQIMWPSISLRNPPSVTHQLPLLCPSKALFHCHPVIPWYLHVCRLCPFWKQADRAGMSLLMWRAGDRERRETKVTALLGTQIHQKSAETSKTSFQNASPSIYWKFQSLNNFEAHHKVAILGIHRPQVSS
jgi:hypothetical protein